MRLSPNAAAQMYPHLTTVSCDKHDAQPRGKVPSHLKGVFASRENPEFVCSACLEEAKQEWDEQQRSLKRAKDQQRQEHRDAIKKAREEALEADKLLSDYMKSCDDAEKTVDSVEQMLNSTRSIIRAKQEKHTKLVEKIRQMVGQSDELEGEILRLSEESLDQFEELTEADNAVTACYNALRDALTEADHLWESLGKSAKKKRDRSLKKSVLAKLKEFDDKRQPANQGNDGSAS